MIKKDIEARTFHRILSLPPYQFVVEHINKTMKEYNSNKYTEDQCVIFKRQYDIILRDLNTDINEMLRMIEIEEDLVKLIEATDNNIFYRKLFFPSVFINNEFKFRDWLIKGILVEESLTDFETGKSVRIVTGIKNDYVIYFTAINPNTKEFWSLTFNLVCKKEHIGGEIEGKELSSIEDHVRNIICNMVDMVDGNDEDLNITIIENSKEQNKKRIEKGKVPFPTKIFIRANGEFKKYVQRFNSESEENEKRKLGHKFLVRGHWRNFRSTRYIHKKGEKTWIKPFWKGEGIIISKNYKLVSAKV